MTIVNDSNMKYREYCKAKFNIKAFAVMAMLLFAPNLALSQTCESLDELACVSSPTCMYEQNSDGKGYVCSPPHNECQTGFVQSALADDGMQIAGNSVELATESCEKNQGCGYIPAGECYCPPDVLCVCGGGTPPNCMPNEGN